MAWSNTRVGPSLVAKTACSETKPSFSTEHNNQPVSTVVYLFFLFTHHIYFQFWEGCYNLFSDLPIPLALISPHHLLLELTSELKNAFLMFRYMHDLSVCLSSRRQREHTRLYQ